MRTLGGQDLGRGGLQRGRPVYLWHVWPDQVLRAVRPSVAERGSL